LGAVRAILRDCLIGEAVGVNNPATVHGAVLSGQYAAAELMRRPG
jgi:flavin-dependent dehydrogenase